MRQVSAEVRCALLLLKTAANTAVIKTFSERQRLPNLFRDLALQLFRGADDLLHFSALAPDARLQLILDLDLIRRPERLTDLFAACKTLNDQQALAAETQLPELLSQLGSIVPREIMAEGFKGKALGEEIKRRQLTICEQASYPQGQ